MCTVIYAYRILYSMYTVDFSGNPVMKKFGSQGSYPLSGSWREDLHLYCLTLL